jgi:predicted nucleotidyltransferase
MPTLLGFICWAKEGLLERLYARNEFTTADNNYIEAHDMPSSSLSLRSASMITSGSKQGFVSCHCKRYCIDKKNANIFKKI